MKKKKHYYFDIQLDPVTIFCIGKNRAEARKNAYAKLRRKNIVKLIDKNNSSLEERI